MPFHLFLDFYSSLLLLVILSQIVFFSPSMMALFHRHHCWLLFFGYFLGFLIAHECDHSFGLLLTSELLFWAIIFSPYTPPWKPAYVLVIYSGNNTVDGDQYCSVTAPISSLLATDGPPVKNGLGSIIRRRRPDGAALIVPKGRNTCGICRRWDCCLLKIVFFWK